MVIPFRIEVPAETLADLGERLARTRWPDEVEGAGWDYGTNLAYLRELVDYWRRGFDWREQEARLNRLPQFRIDLGGIDLHFVHVRGAGPDPFPLVLTHGWPSSFCEMVKIIGPLTDPARHGADPHDAFDVVIPSLPGYGFSGWPQRRGLIQVDRLWRRLMIEQLGYRRFGACGGDIGARVTSALGRYHGDVVAGVHLESVDLEWPEPVPADLSPAEQDYLGRVARWEKEQGAYGEIQSSFPATPAYALNDSPAGLAAWIVEKFRAWSDCDGDLEARFTKDELLTNITIYWVTQTIGPSMRRYFEARHDRARRPLAPGERIETPAGIAMFPGERLLTVPREWAARCYNIVRWTDMPRGGHFPAMEEPGLLVEDIREFFRPIRSAQPLSPHAPGGTAARHGSEVGRR